MELKNLCFLIVALYLNFSVDCYYAESETSFEKIDKAHEQDLGAEKILNDLLEREEENEKSFDSDVNEELVRQAEAIADEDLLSGLNTILKNNETLEDVMKIEGITEIP